MIEHSEHGHRGVFYADCPDCQREDARQMPLSVLTALCRKVARYDRELALRLWEVRCTPRQGEQA